MVREKSTLDQERKQKKGQCHKQRIKEAVFLWCCYYCVLCVCVCVSLLLELSMYLSDTHRLFIFKERPSTNNDADIATLATTFFFLCETMTHQLSWKDCSFCCCCCTHASSHGTFDHFFLGIVTCPPHALVSSLLSPWLTPFFTHPFLTLTCSIFLSSRTIASTMRQWLRWRL